MNILIISFDADPPNMGGTSTVVNVLARNFIQKGHFVALGYFIESKYPSVFFKTKIKLSSENRTETVKFFEKYSFDIIYNTQAPSTDFDFLKSLPLNNAKIISAYHNKPLLRFFPLESLMNIYYDSNNILYKLFTLSKIPLLPIWKIKSQYREKKQYEKFVQHSDKVQLLSEKFYPVFLKILPKTETNKLIAIANPIVFDRIFPIEQLKNKEKKVLVVCSTNYQKRASLMLKIWAEIEKEEALADWTFDFVGGGEGFNRILNLVKKLNLKRINFLGFQNPEKYYESSAIFMMTSRFEGWPMVLMEAMQMGVVPIVFNSFESLPDIINDGENGIIVPNNKLSLFTSKMKWLMQDPDKRISMAEAAIKKSELFSADIIGNQYLDMFNKIISK